MTKFITKVEKGINKYELHMLSGLQVERFQVDLKNKSVYEMYKESTVPLLEGMGSFVHNIESITKQTGVKLNLVRIRDGYNTKNDDCNVYVEGLETDANKYTVDRDWALICVQLGLNRNKCVPVKLVDVEGDIFEDTEEKVSVIALGYNLLNLFDTYYYDANKKFIDILKNQPKYLRDVLNATDKEAKAQVWGNKDLLDYLYMVSTDLTNKDEKLLNVLYELLNAYTNEGTINTTSVRDEIIEELKDDDNLVSTTKNEIYQEIKESFSKKLIKEYTRPNVVGNLELQLMLLDEIKSDNDNVKLDTITKENLEAATYDAEEFNNYLTLMFDESLTYSIFVKMIIVLNKINYNLIVKHIQEVPNLTGIFNTILDEHTRYKEMKTNYYMN